MLLGSRKSALLVRPRVVDAARVRFARLRVQRARWLRRSMLTTSIFPLSESQCAGRFRGTQHLVDRRPRRAREAREIFLREWDRSGPLFGAVEPREQQDLSKHPFLHGNEQSFEQPIRDRSKLRLYHSEEHFVNRWVSVPDHVEVVSVNGQGLNCIETLDRPQRGQSRSDTNASSPTIAPGPNTDRIALSPSGVVTRTATCPVRDQVQSITRIALMKDHRARRIASSVRRAEDTTKLMRR